LKKPRFPIGKIGVHLLLRKPTDHVLRTHPCHKKRLSIFIFKQMPVAGRTLSFGIKRISVVGAANRCRPIRAVFPPLTAWAKGAVRIPGADNNEAD